MNYEKKIEQILNIIPHKTRVLFAIACAESVTDKLDKEIRKPALEAIASAKAWVNSPTEKNRLKAEAAAHSAASSAAYSASSAASSASSAASSAAYSAAHSAAYSAYSASSASSAAFKNKYKELYFILLKVCDFTKLEKLIYKIKTKEKK